MFDPIDPDTLNQANQAHAVNYLAIIIALEKKGLLTLEEFNRAKIQATHIIEQDFAQKRDDTEREFDKQHPGVRKFLGKLGFPQ